MQAQTRELSQEQSILSVAGAIFRHKWLFYSLFSIVILAVIAITLFSKKQYRSEMMLLLENDRSNAVLTPDRSTPPPPSEITEQQIMSELEVISSEDVLTAVADPGWKTLTPSQRTPAALKQHEDRLTSFRKRLKIEPARKSNVIDVSYTAGSPAEATDMLERFSAAYLTHRKHLSRPTGTSDFFADEARRYKEAWQKANSELVTFQQENKLVSVQETEQTLSKAIAADEDDLQANQNSLAELSQRLVAAGKAEAKLPERQQTQQHTVLNQGSVDQMRTLIVQLQNRRTELLTRYKPSDRLVVELDREIADTRSSLETALKESRLEDTTDVNPAWQGVKTSLIEAGIERQALVAQGDSLRRALAEHQARLARLQSLDVRFNTLQEQADQARSNFEVFSEKRDQAQIEDAMDDRQLINIAVAQSPTSAFHPVSPKPLLNAALGLLTALFLAGGAVYGAEYVRSTFATPRELEMTSRYPVLATVPYIAEADRALHPSNEGSLRAPARRFSLPRLIPAMQNLGKMMKREFSRNSEMFPGR
jgi:uncharacterized protein involved in exopolysaccharide biosynthesis